MSSYVRRMAVGSTLALGVWLLTGGGRGADEDEDEKLARAAQKDIVGLAESLKGGKLTPEQVQAVRKKHELEHIMYVFKPRDKGGLGVGPKGPGDGIEIKFVNLAKRAPAKMTDRQKEDLLRMARVTAAMGDLTALYPEPKSKKGKTPADWKKYSADMKKTALDFIKAVEAGNSRKLKEAAKNVNTSCEDCHVGFRD
jgi:hypothetical protein